MPRHQDLFTNRQLVALATLSNLIVEARKLIEKDAAATPRLHSQAVDYANAVALYLSFVLSKVLDYNCALVPWYPQEDRPSHLFTRQAIPMVWDFAELSPFSGIGGSWLGSVRVIADVLDSDSLAPSGSRASISPMNAEQVNYKLGLVSTDPPYYDNNGVR